MSMSAKKGGKSALSLLLLLLSLTFVLIPSSPAFADAEFNRLFAARSFKALLDYADEKMPPPTRTTDQWVKLGRANEAMEFPEKALACYMVAWRLESSDYHALLGIARVYNGMSQPDLALPMAEAALSVNFTAEASWEFARACIALNKPADAKQALEKIMESDPKNAIANRELGNIYFNDKEFAKAIPLLRRSYQERSDGTVAFRIGRAYLETGVPDSATIYLKIAADRNVNAAEARGLMARALVNSKKFREAQEPLEALIRAEPNNLEYLRLLAACYQNENAREKLAEIDGRIVALDKKDRDTRLRIAAYAESKGQLETAFNMYREVTQLDPKDAASFRKLADIANRRRMGAQAVAAMREYIKLKPSEAEAHRDVGDFQYHMKDFDGALASYRTALRLDPQIKGFHQRYAEVVIAKGQTAEVITALNAVIKNGDADVGTYTTLGTIYHGRKQYREAIEMYREALKLEPANFDALTALANSQAASGDVNGAVITYEQALMMNTDAVQEHKTLGDLYTRQKKGPEALRSYMKYLDKNPTDRVIVATVGRLLFERGEFAEAVKYISRSQTNDPAVQLIYAEASLRANNPGNAIATLEELRNRKPRPANIARILMLLGEAYEKDGKPGLAGQAYAEYIGLPGVKDQDAAHKAAFLQEKDNPTAAIRRYEANIRAYPNDMRNILRLGVLFSQRNEHAKALPLLQRSTAAADADPELWLEIAKVYNAMGRDSSELAAYQRYTRTNPQHVEANRRIGSLLMRRGDFNNAMVHLELANTMSPNDPAVLSLLARGYVHTRRNDEAINVLTRAKTAKPDDADIRYQLYELYKLTKQPQKAMEEIRDLSKMKKEGRYLLAYGQALIAQANVKDAEGIVAELLSQDPMNTDALMLRGFILRSRSNFQDALEAYEEVISILPGHAPALYEMAETFVLLRQMPRAEMSYRRALRADPNYALAELGLAKLFKSRRQMDLYRQHLQNAQRLAPDNDQVMEEVRNAAAGK